MRPDPCTLIETCRRLLACRPKFLTLQTVADAIGVSKSWLEQFSAGNIPDPSTSKMQNMYEFLTASKLELVNECAVSQLFDYVNNSNNQ